MKNQQGKDSGNATLCQVYNLERLAASRSEEAPQDDWNEPCNQCGGFRGHAEGCTGHRAPAAGSTERWIPVSERLPETAAGVLIARGETVEEACYEGEERGWELIRTDAYDMPINLHGEVTHWMPLPEPPVQNQSQTETTKP